MSLLFLLDDEDSDVIPRFTWAGKPSATGTAPGYRIYITDVGPSGSEWVSDGTNWLPHNGHVLLARSASAVSVTGTASETALATVTIPAGLMGTNGQLRITALWSYTNSGNTKTMRVRLGGISGTAYLALASTVTATAQNMTIIRNRNAANSQVGYASAIAASFGNGTSANVTSSVDTSAAQDLVISGQLANTGETITLDSYTVELLR